VQVNGKGTVRHGSLTILWLAESHRIPLAYFAVLFDALVETVFVNGHLRHVHDVLFVLCRESLVAVLLARQVKGLSQVSTRLSNPALRVNVNCSARLLRLLLGRQNLRLEWLVVLWGRGVVLWSRRSALDWSIV